jgi:hypothetical protein
MATMTRVVGNKEGDVDEEGNGDSNEGPTAWSCATTMHQSISGQQGLGWNSRGKAQRLINTFRRGFGTT